MITNQQLERVYQLNCLTEDIPNLPRDRTVDNGTVAVIMDSSPLKVLMYDYKNNVWNDITD